MARAVIITSYLEYPVDLPALLQPEDLILCLDGGYDIAKKQDIRPHVLLGDFDSIDPSAEPALSDNTSGIRVLRYPPEKDYTDLELALRVLNPEKRPDLLIVGGLGGRLDQTLINIQLLQRYTASPGEWEEEHPGFDPVREDREDFLFSEDGEDMFGSYHRFRRIDLMDGRSHCFVLQGHEPAPEEPDPRPLLIPRKPGHYLSLLPLTDVCSGTDLTGVKYPLQDAVLRRGSSLSISNEFEADKAMLRLKRGSLLVVITRGNDRDFI